MGSNSPMYSDGLGDSIYTAFVLQEAIRLVERSTEKKTNENTLIM